MFSSQPFRPVWACCVRGGRRRTARLDRSGVSCDWSSRLNRRSWSWGWGNCRRPMRLNSWNLRTWGRWGENTHIKCCSLNPVWSGNVWCINSSFCGMNIKITQGGVEVFLWHERGWSDLWRPVNIMWECKQEVHTGQIILQSSVSVSNRYFCVMWLCQGCPDYMLFFIWTKKENVRQL